MAMKVYHRVNVSQIWLKKRQKSANFYNMTAYDGYLA